ncbi:hypothetical protein GCK72_006883 [Caenorhabditis remanei]|uniref:Uncharacterized protein n=1 Tax=Caenorhabditis remanei TaxID=31234 RepID=A0A6A5HHG3_CAERE|nr:hypothetical protein GCK72_006883 [Caenorhabditis remanei]KAF1766925.1 hypothetical protein GCK72_006883 [Caenorhabditis remanei]
MPLFPILAGYCEGFVAKYLGIWSHYLIGLQLSSMIFQVECLVFCFAIKHQNIGRVISYNVVSDTYYYGGIVFFIFTPIGAFVVFVLSGMKREDQLAHIKLKHPEYYDEFSKLPNFSIYQFNFWSLILAGSACCGALVCGAAFTIITMDIFRMLKTLQKKVSAASFKKYQSAVKSLLVQFATSGLLLVPLSGFVLFTLISFDKAQLFVEITLLTGALHPIVNAIVLTMTTSQFREVVFGFIFGKASGSVLRVFPFKSQKMDSREQQKSVNIMHTEIGSRTMV